MKKFYVVFVLLFFPQFTISAAEADVNAITPGQFIIDPPTLHCLGFRWYVDGDDNGNATVQVAYRQTGTQQWKQALNMLRVNREVVDRDYDPYTCDNLFAGSILGLNPGTSYDVNFVLVDPDGGQATQSVTVQTRSVPIDPPPTAILNVYPPGWSGNKNQPSYDSLSTAFAVVQPGQQILLYPGTHTGNATINVAGTAASPVVIKGAGPGEAIVYGLDTINNGKNLEITGSTYLFIENITVDGGLYGIYAGGINPAAGTKNLVVRNCLITDVMTGITGSATGCENWYIADNTLIGRNQQWYPYDSNHSSEDGIRVYGHGHDICYNHIERFWDCMGIANNLPDPNIQLKCVAIDMYGNDVRQAHDDCVETDFGCHNIRVWGNRFIDAQDAISCQPIYGGPVYIIRNEIYDCNYTPYKLHNWPSGIYIFNNTSVLYGQGFTSDPIWQNATLRNNLIIGTQNYSMETGSPDPRTTLDYDGYRKTDDPDRFLKWYLDGSWDGNVIRSLTLADFYASLGFEQHGIMVDFNDFRNCPVPVVGQVHSPNDYDLRLATGSRPIDKGLIIPTVSENYNGSAPDIGCYEYGDLPPHYGPRGNTFYDYSKFAAQWGQTGCSAPDWCGGQDLDKNGEIDWADLAVIANQWLQAD